MYISQLIRFTRLCSHVHELKSWIEVQLAKRLKRATGIML